MTRRRWVRLDNASNIFLAARTSSDPKVFRLSAEMDHEVDPQLLQRALDLTYDQYRLYRAVLRRGVFWYYLQDSDLRPVVTEENLHTCAPIYQADRRTLLFRVEHHRRRIVLEVFHALSDGTGALWFLTDLVTAYLRLRYPEQPPAAEPVHELSLDSFAHYFRRRRDAAPRQAPVSALGSGAERDPGADVDRPAPWGLGRLRRASGTRVYRVRGTRTPDHRTRAVELTMPAPDVLALARAEGVSLTIYLTALFFESVRRSSGDLGRARTLAASVPVNLRQFFPSTSPRNFFATVRVEHTYGDGPDDLGAICRNLESQFRPKAAPEALETKLRRFIQFERTPALRIVPRPLKDVILGVVNRISNRSLTVAVSNLGRVTLPEPADSHVRRMLFHVSAARPQFCAISHAGLLTVTFTSPFSETDHIREFARSLTANGIDVVVAAARVTEDELAEAEAGTDAGTDGEEKP
ncbi:alcohol acetyltransferase [Citricoccus sp. GCM10030269]|uniref:alcohol acetyltransferase n=1 Tax=Citricoccus sp. GCM10030269 TaxID=3273388 RepID=UPI00360F3E05